MLVRTAALQDIDTPALLIDEARLQRNIDAMARNVAAAGLEMWPHVKTHKSVAVARRQRAAGASGFTVSTVHEAETFASAGLAPLLLAQPPVGDWRIARLLDLARRVHVRVLIDSPETAATLEAAAEAADIDLEALWEVDAGADRTGTPPGKASAETLARTSARCRRLGIVGLLTYPGQAYAGPDRDALLAAAEREEDAHASTLAALPKELQPTVAVRSVGSTPTSGFFAVQPSATQARPGNYVFYDATQVALGVARVDDCALSVLGTVIARPDEHRVILDCGSKSLASERMSRVTPDLGLVLEHPELQVARLWEEHAVLRTSGRSDAEVGDRMRIVPNHACTAANLHDSAYVVRDGSIVDVWSIDARGWTTSQSS
jgi:D-serine deaminase-like pyridoxal phosphate-dependent protein